MASNENYVIRVRRGTTNEWAVYNPILGAGELGFDTTATRLKVGDGLNVWSNLDFATGNSFDVARDAGFVGTLSEWLESIKGKDGIDGVGPANVLTVGTVSTGPEPAVTISGDSPNQVIDFTFPAAGEPIEYSKATPTADGLMPKEDKATLDGATAYGKDFIKSSSSNIARGKLNLSEGATSISGTASEIKPNSTETTSRVWSPKILGEYIENRDNVKVTEAKTYTDSEIQKNKGSVKLLNYVTSTGYLVDNTDSLLTASADAKSAGVPLILSGLHGIRPGTVLPAGLSIKCESARFRLLTPSTDFGLTINSETVIDGRLDLVLAPNTTTSRGIFVTGSDISIDSVRVVASVSGTGVGDGEANQLKIQGNNINIGRVFCQSSDFPIVINDSLRVSVDYIEIRNYLRGIYVKDSKEVNLRSGSIYQKSPNARNNPGNNSILMESFTDGAVADIWVSNFILNNAGEHAFRLGGQFEIRRVTVDNCVARNAGACGFKMLGGAPTTTTYHTDIKFINCIAEDVGTDSTSHAGFLVERGKRVVLENPIVRNSIAQNSAGAGIQFQGVYNITISNPMLFNTLHCGIRMSNNFGDSSDIRITGGVIQTNTGKGIEYYYRRMGIDRFYFEGNTKLNLGAGQTSIALIDTDSTGYLSNCWLTLESVNSLILEGTETSTAWSKIYVDFRAPFQDIPAKNGSKWLDLTTGDYKIRKSGSWQTL